MKAKSTALALLLLLLSTACGSGNGPDPTPTPTPDPQATAPGNFFVTSFAATNTSNPQDVVDGDSIGLSLYFVLNEDGSLSGVAQTPMNPPATTDFTGLWELDDGALTFSFIDEAGDERVVSGALGFDAEDDVVFVGSQSGGPPIEIDDSGQTYDITTLEMQKYSAPVTNADFAGEWNAASITEISNDDPEVQQDGLAGGATQTITFNENGTFTATFTEPGETPDEIAGTYELLDPFHLRLTIGDDEPDEGVYSLIDGELTVYLYDQERSFNGGGSVPATQIIVLQRN